MYFQLRLSESTSLYVPDAAEFQTQLGHRLNDALRERSTFLDSDDLLAYIGANLEPMILAKSSFMSLDVDVISDSTIIAIVSVPSLDNQTPTKH